MLGDMTNTNTTTYRQGIWTPSASVLCFECHGPKLHGRPGTLKVETPTFDAIPEGAGATKCEECDCDIVTDDKVAAEHNLVLALRDRGFTNASMMQTGGMCSGLMLPFGDGSMWWAMYGNDEEPDLPADRFWLMVSDEDGLLDGEAPAFEQESNGALTMEWLLTYLTESETDGGTPRAFGCEEIDAAKATLARSAKREQVREIRRHLDALQRIVGSDEAMHDDAVATRLVDRYKSVLSVPTVYPEDVRSALAGAGQQPLLLTASESAGRPADGTLAVVTSVEHPEVEFRVSVDAISVVRVFSETRSSHTHHRDGFVAAQARALAYTEKEFWG